METRTTKVFLAVSPVMQRSYGLTGSRYRYKAEWVAFGTSTVMYKGATQDTKEKAEENARKWLTKQAGADFSCVESVSK